MKFFHELLTKASTAFKRFPIVMLWAIAGSVHFIISIEGEYLFEQHFNLDMVFILGISWLIGTAFFAEQFKKPIKLWWVKLLVLLLLAFYFWMLPENYDDADTIVLTRWWLYLLAGHVFIFFAPFVKTWDNIAYWNYLKNIMIAIGRSLLFSAVLYGGLALAVLASDTLFSLAVDDEFYGQLFVFCLGIVNTCIYLSDFPKNIQENKNFVFNKALAVFVKFILIPLLLLYFAILYAYGFKILFNWELPEGWLSGLLCTLAVVGFVVQIMINPWKKNSSNLVRKFHPWFYWLLLPLLTLLFLAVFRRISDYNFTEARYLLMLLSFWILGVCLYLLIGKRKQMRVLPISFFILVLLSSIGPWGAFSISINAQLNELEEVFAKIDLQTNSLEAQHADRFENIARYLAKRNELKRLEPIIGFDAEKAFGDEYSWRIGTKILDSLNVKTLAVEQMKNIGGRYFYFNRDQQVMLKLDSFTNFAELDYGNLRFPDEPTMNKIKMTWQNQKFHISKNENEEKWLAFSLNGVLMETLKEDYGLDSLDPKKLEFEFENEKGSFKVVFTELSLTVKNEMPEITSAKAFLFFNPKK